MARSAAASPAAWPVLDGEDVTEAIREHQISAYASKVAAHPAVRDFLMEMQRKAGINTQMMG